MTTTTRVGTWAACSADIKKNAGQLFDDTEPAGFCLGCGADLGLPHFHVYYVPNTYPEGYCTECAEIEIGAIKVS